MPILPPKYLGEGRKLEMLKIRCKNITKLIENSPFV